MPMAVRWSAMWPMFLSLVRPDKISSPITISAALTIARLAPVDSWSMGSVRRRFFTLQAKHKIGVGCGFCHVPRALEKTHQILLPDGAVVLDDQKSRQQGAWRLAKV